MKLSWNKSFNIADRKVGEGQLTFIIAEAGVAHFGDLEKAFRLVDLAADSGADAVKFQIFKTNEMISSSLPEWQERMRQKELRHSDFKEIKKHCETKGIIFFATAHDETSLDALDDLDVPVYKVGSGEVKNWQFLSKVARRGKPTILSTGMYTTDDVKKALLVVSQSGNFDLALLQCSTAYPTPPKEVNLLAIKAMADKFGVVTGYSDHTEGWHFSLAAVAMGAKVIEKHITLEYDIPNAQDWKVSCGPDNLHLMISQIREIEDGLGTGEKVPGATEKLNTDWARKSLIAARDLVPGEVVLENAVKSKRPGTGIPPSKIDKVVGREVKGYIKADTLITWEDLI